jgi:hypothetical protein
VKWFQVDSDTPNDPKMKAVVRELGPSGIGGLFLIWCHIADHGLRKPGWSIDSSGKPMPLADLIETSNLTPTDFDRLASLCVSSGHWLKKPWATRRVIAIPAMVRRADTYTKRLVRTRAEVRSPAVERNFDNKTTQDKQMNTPLTPLRGGRNTKRRLSAAERRRVAENAAFGASGCPHHPQCSRITECTERTIAEGRRERFQSGAVSCSNPNGVTRGRSATS